MYLLLLCQICRDINWRLGGKQAHLITIRLSDKLRTIKGLVVCNGLVLRAFGPAKQSGHRLFSTVPWGIIYMTRSLRIKSIFVFLNLRGTNMIPVILSKLHILAFKTLCFVCSPFPVGLLIIYDSNIQIILSVIAKNFNIGFKLL